MRRPPMRPSAATHNDNEGARRVSRAPDQVVEESARVEDVGSVGAVDDGACDIGESSVVATGVAAQRTECRVHVDAAPLGENTLGLFDDRPCVQRGLSC